MLNKLQEQQWQAVKDRLNEFREGDISNTLLMSFIEQDDLVDFLNQAVKFKRKDDGYVDGVLHIDNPIGFFDANRFNMIQWFESQPKMSNSSALIAITDAVNNTMTIDDGEVSAHEVGHAVYGDNEGNQYYFLVAKRLSMFFAEKASELFFDVALNLEGLPLIQAEYHIDRYLDLISKGKRISGMTFPIAKFILDTVDADEFAKQSIEAIGEGVKFNEFREGCIENVIKFYDFNRLDILNFLDDYYSNIASIDHKPHDLIVALHTRLIDYAFVGGDNEFTVDHLTRIIYGNKHSNKFYNEVITGLTSIVINKLSEDYVAFYDSIDE